MDEINIENLPREILSHVCSFLEAYDIRCLSLVSRKFKDTTDFEGIWRRLCYTDYKIELGSNEKRFSARTLYTKTRILINLVAQKNTFNLVVLRPYGFLIGLWRVSVEYYGGLLDIQYEQGQLVGVELYAPYFLGCGHPLKRRKLFSVGFDSDGERVLILTSAGKEAKIQLLKRNDTNAFEVCLLQSENPFPNSSSQEEEFQKWLEEQGYGPSTPGYDPEIDNPAELRNRFKANYWNSCIFYKIRMPRKKPIYPIPPGLFKANYSVYGPELIMLTYDEDEPKATALKITGDPNVPAGNVTFFANLNHPLHGITWEDQESCESLNQVVAENVPYIHEDFTNTPPGVFRVPNDLSHEFEEPLPENSIGRFQGFCQLVDEDNQNPWFSHGHWVILDYDTFIFLFLEFSWMNIYYRVTDPPFTKLI